MIIGLSVTIYAFMAFLTFAIAYSVIGQVEPAAGYGVFWPIVLPVLLFRFLRYTMRWLFDR
jgi:hypothetical protein